MHRTIYTRTHCSLTTASNAMVEEAEFADQAPESIGTIAIATGEVFTVTKWFDRNGHDCDPADAEFAISDTCADGVWQTIELGQFSQHRVQ